MDADTPDTIRSLRIAPSSAERRRHARFVLPAGYTPLRIRFLDDDAFTVDGTAYDISVGGVRFEADRGVEPGTTVALQIEVPGLGDGAPSGVAGPGRAVFVFATIVWIEDEDEPGPVKMAAVFSRFARAGDEQRLHAAVATGRFRRAA